MSYSDTWDAFAKLALEKGLIKTAEESKELKDYKNSDYPRVGSDDIKKIENLYGLKPDLPEDMRYEFNISQDAHPNQVIIAPSYDKLNGLVENINERQQILINIMRKPVNGFLIQKKYAESELTHALVSIANDLDNHNNDQLRILADTCIDQLNTLTKTALGPLAIVGIAAAVLGAVYLYNHINTDEGLVKNVQNALTQIDDLIGEDWFHQTFYATLKPEFLHQLTKLRSDLQSLLTEAEQFNTIDLQVHSLKTAEDIKQTAETSGQDIVQKAEAFRNFLIHILPEIISAIDLFSQTNVRELAVKDDTWFSGLVSKIEPVFHGHWGLFTDRFEDVRQALVTLKESMNSTKEEINRLDDTAEHRQAAVKQILAQQASYAPHKAIETTPENTESAPKEEPSWQEATEALKALSPA